jgi:Rne/Rng family ribonuclease
MRKSLVISEQDNIAALLENDRIVEFFVNRGELLLGDIYTASVENILPGIDAAFVNLGKDKMGFLHANDVPGQGPLKERLVPKQKLMVQITKEPTGHKGPRVSTAISLPGRFLVLVPEERGVSISRRISDSRERARLKSVVSLLKPPGVGLIIRTEAKGQNESELFEDFEQLWDRWQTCVSEGEASIGPTLIYRDQDLLYRVIRDAYSSDVGEIIVDTADGQRRGQQFLSGWSSRHTQVVLHTAEEPLLFAKNIDKEIEQALSDRVELPSGGHLVIQPTEALTVIDVNSGRFTSSRTQAETVRRTNLEASAEIPRQLRLRNIGGMVIVDFIDMESRKDQQQVLEVFQRHLEEDRAKPQVGQLSDLGLVELTRRRQGQSLRELFTTHCPTCSGLGCIPQLEIGTGEFKRSISVRTKEEEAASRGRSQMRRSGKQQSGGLRSATAYGNRIQHQPLQQASSQAVGKVSMESEAASIVDDLANVPEEILEQMPEELLAGGTERAFKHAGLAEPAEEQDEEYTQGYAKGRSEGKSRFDRSERSGGEKRGSRESDHDDSDSEEFVARSAHDVEQEFVESLDSGDEPVREGLEEDISYAHGDDRATQDFWPDDDKPVYVESESPFQVEPEPITGVFRLKAKSPSDKELVSAGGGDSEYSDSAQLELPIADKKADSDEDNI